MSTGSSPESAFLSVGFNDRFVIDGRQPITGRIRYTVANCIMTAEGNLHHG